jgi:hypothetical protein
MVKDLPAPVRKDEKVLSDVMIKKNCHKEKNGTRRSLVVILQVVKNSKSFLSEFEGMLTKRVKLYWAFWK